ncbi:transposase zinc-binding domain-containing protein, partial [Clostridium boliviensis]
MHKIQEIFQSSYSEYCGIYNPTEVQNKAALSILNCKSGKLGCNISICEDCGHSDIHNNSCRNRNCPCCQSILKELWIDARKTEVIDSLYFHVVFTLPAELNPLIYCNQSLLYSLMHKCASETLLELSADKKYLGATPGIIQVLHTWGQKLNFHPHIHCIITGAGLTKTKQLRKSQKKFFIPVRVLGKMFRGKFLNQLQLLYEKHRLHFPNQCPKLKNSYEWNEFTSSLYD